MKLPVIDLQDYTYQLPEQKIAKYPLEQRDHSKLLVYSGGAISHDHFYNLEQHLPTGSTLVFNNTRVIPARLYFTKPTGATIEIFLLNPLAPHNDINLAMQVKSSATWSCMVGNRKRWKQGQVLQRTLQIAGSETTLSASMTADNNVELHWDNTDIRFVDLISHAGQIPLPPYLGREAEKQDRIQYQTIYSKMHGAVAAPTAGLHFTKNLMESLGLQGVTKEYITLHVGAGTFQPIKVSTVYEHPMHGEQIHLTLNNINRFMEADTLIAVGTTSLRTLESLYWYGVNLINQGNDEFFVAKLAPYEKYRYLPDFKETLQAIKVHMEKKQFSSITGRTEIFLFPPYRIKSCSGLITNFHLPASTLILLVAAMVGDHWKQIYQEALERDYRFLSYGDSSLLLPAIQ